MSLYDIWRRYLGFSCKYHWIETLPAVFSTIKDEILCTYTLIPLINSMFISIRKICKTNITAKDCEIYFFYFFLTVLSHFKFFILSERPPSTPSSRLYQAKSLHERRQRQQHWRRRLGRFKTHFSFFSVGLNSSAGQMAGTLWRITPQKAVFGFFKLSRYQILTLFLLLTSP